MQLRLPLAFFLAGSLMEAVTFTTIPGSGVELIAGGSPEFNQLVTEYFGPNPFRTLEGIVPYLVIVLLIEGHRSHSTPFAPVVGGDIPEDSRPPHC